MPETTYGPFAAVHVVFDDIVPLTLVAALTGVTSKKQKNNTPIATDSRLTVLVATLLFISD
jgi:hypothetical protein